MAENQEGGWDKPHVGTVIPDARVLKDQFLDAFNGHDLDRMLRCHSRDAVLVTPAGVTEGHDEISSFYQDFFDGFPDLRMTVWHTVTCADPAVSEWVLTGTHTGPFLLPEGEMLQGTGRPVTVRGTSTCTVSNGKIITHRIYFDQLELYSQLGAKLNFDDVPTIEETEGQTVSPP
ncbi:ester cyclase [Acrocarpospora catenulata]|uniref:ester cyclase n=1 Tax=Acrocarpospora catenulata TaxID=2836182 RepID=UPI0027DF0ED2|nr:ester cyclase [Acrocarpospora catenulata]